MTGGLSGVPKQANFSEICLKLKSVHVTSGRIGSPAARCRRTEHGLPSDSGSASVAFLQPAPSQRIRSLASSSGNCSISCLARSIVRRLQPRTPAAYSIPPCPNFAASTAAYRRPSFFRQRLAKCTHLPFRRFVIPPLETESHPWPSCVRFPDFTSIAVDRGRKDT